MMYAVLLAFNLALDLKNGIVQFNLPEIVCVRCIAALLL